MHTTARRYLIVKPRFALLLLLALTGLAATNMLHSQRAEAAGGDPIVHWDSSMIYPGQNNGYPWGPVGEQVRIHGAKFTAGEVVGQTIKLALLQGDVNNPPGGGSSYEFCKLAGPKLAIGQANVDGSGTFDYNFTWPAIASSGMYSVCAYNTLDGLPVGNIDDGPFTVLSSHAPSVAIAHTSVAAGESVTVTGKNWTPPQAVNVYIAACVDCDGPIVVAGTAHSSGLNAGTFSITLTIPATTTPGDYVAGANAHSVLDVGPAGGKHIAITAAVATPTVAATVTAAQSTAAAGSGTGDSNNSDSLAGLSPLVLILAGAGILVLLLLITLLIVALSRRGSNKTPPGATISGPTPNWGSPGSPAGSYLPYSGGTAPPAGGSVQQNWQTLPPGWGDQTPPTVSPGMPQGDDSPTRPGTYGG